MNIAHALGERMCAAWGINPAECRGISVVWKPNEMPVAHVELLLSEQAAYELLTLGVIEREMVKP